MSKQIWKPGTMIYPIPAVMVSCGKDPGDYNIITIAWTGIISTNPPMCSISIRPERHSYEIIKKDMAFIINLTNQELAFAADYCGVKSGRDMNKFDEMKLTPVKAEKTGVPYIDQAPLSLECIVKEIIKLGSHDMFISEIISIIADEKYIDPKTNALNLEKTKPLAYCHGKYYTLGEFQGKFGWSVEKKKKSKKTPAKQPLKKHLT